MISSFVNSNFNNVLKIFIVSYLVINSEYCVAKTYSSSQEHLDVIKNACQPLRNDINKNFGRSRVLTKFFDAIDNYNRNENCRKECISFFDAEYYENGNYSRIDLNYYCVEPFSEKSYLIREADENIVLFKDCMETDADACLKLDEKGWLFDEDFPFSLKACMLNSGAGCYAYANYLWKNKKYKDAYKILEKGCDLNDAGSCRDLAYQYTRVNPGIPRDLQKSHKFYQKGCDLGDMKCCNNL